MGQPMHTTAPIPNVGVVTPLKPLDEMSVYDMMVELRSTPNPTTHKDHHTTSEIAAIAGSSKGWPAWVMQSKPKDGQNRNPRFRTNIRDYLKERRKRLAIPSAPSTPAPPAIRRRPREVHQQKLVTLPRMTPAHIHAFVNTPPDGDMRSIAPAAPAHQGPLGNDPLIDVLEVVDEALDATKAPAPLEREVPVPESAPVLAAPVTKTRVFIEEFETLKARLWSETEAMDALAAKAPALFRPGIEKLREDLFGILTQLEE